MTDEILDAMSIRAISFDLDAALDVARRGAVAGEGPVEVRPFQGE